MHNMGLITTNGVAWSVCWSRSWALQKRLNWSRCRLGTDLCGWVQRTRTMWESKLDKSVRDKSVMRPFAKLLWTLVYAVVKLMYE